MDARDDTTDKEKNERTRPSLRWSLTLTPEAGWQHKFQKQYTRTHSHSSIYKHAVNDYN